MSDNHQNTAAFSFLAWISFAISSLGTLAGIIYLEGDLWMKGFLAMGYLFSLTSCFTVAKVVRDKHEAEKFAHKIEKAKQNKILKDYDLD
ncbi:MAG: hypothetical protein JJT94_14060 [Bernardetiaceae bacterium]|nr:hypothetical protein [Bernardetiaceae bacterium]